MKMSDLDAHPVFSKNFTVQTNAIAEASNEALDSIFMRQTGLIFYGMSRVGKTCCIKAIKSKLGNFMPRAYITQIEVAKKEGSFTNNIIEQLAHEEGMVLTSKLLSITKLNVITDVILLRCRERSCNHWVLLLDEFQKLRMHDMSLLGDIFNRLDRKGITMTVLSFAMNSIFSLRDDLKREKVDSAQLIARFMSRFVRFNGCTNEADLKVILCSFDHNSEYPPGSACSYTAGFVPAAYSKGFRLENFSSSFWKELNTVTAGGYKNNIPMEHILLSLRYFIRFITTRDAENLSLPANTLEEIVKKSNLQSFCVENGHSQ